MNQLRGTFSKFGWDYDLCTPSIDDHLSDINEAQDEAANGSNGEVRAAAREEIPTLQKQLALVRSCQYKLIR